MTDRLLIAGAGVELYNLVSGPFIRRFIRPMEPSDTSFPLRCIVVFCVL